MKTSAKILSILLPTTAVAMLTAGLMNYGAVNAELRAVTEAHQSELSEMSARQITASLKSIRDELTWAARHPDVVSMKWDSMSGYLSDVASSSAEKLTNLMLIEPSGDYYFAGLGRVEGRNLSDRKYFRDVMAGGTPFAMTSPDYSRMTGKKKYTLAVPIHAEGEGPKGCLASNISLDILSGMVTDGNDGDERIMWVVDERTYVIGAADKGLLLEYRLSDHAGKSEGVAQIAGAVRAREKSSCYVTLESGKRYFATCQPIGGTPGWALVSAVAEDKMTSLAGGMIRRIALALTLTLLVAVVTVRSALREE